MSYILTALLRVCYVPLLLSAYTLLVWRVLRARLPAQTTELRWAIVGLFWALTLCLLLILGVLSVLAQSAGV